MIAGRMVRQQVFGRIKQSDGSRRMSVSTVTMSVRAHRSLVEFNLDVLESAVRQTVEHVSCRIDVCIRSDMRSYQEMERRRDVT